MGLKVDGVSFLLHDTFFMFKKFAKKTNSLYNIFEK